MKENGVCGFGGLGFTKDLSEQPPVRAKKSAAGPKPKLKAKPASPITASTKSGIIQVDHIEIAQKFLTVAVPKNSQPNQASSQQSSNEDANLSDQVNRYNQPIEASFTEDGISVPLHCLDPRQAAKVLFLECLGLDANATDKSNSRIFRLPLIQQGTARLANRDDEFLNLNGIEDDVVVTPGGHEVLTHGAPRLATDVEALMRSFLALRQLAALKNPH